jgi:hypothetical protein
MQASTGEYEARSLDSLEQRLAFLVGLRSTPSPETAKPRLLRASGGWIKLWLAGRQKVPD